MAVALVISYFWLANSELAFWLLLLPINLAILTAYTLFTGQDVKVGKTKYSLSTNVRMLILGVLFALVGFVVGGPNGGFIGVLIAGAICTTIEYFLKKNSRKKQ